VEIGDSEKLFPRLFFGYHQFGCCNHNNVLRTAIYVMIIIASLSTGSLTCKHDLTTHMREEPGNKASTCECKCLLSSCRQAVGDKVPCSGGVCSTLIQGCYLSLVTVIVVNSKRLLKVST